MGEESPEAGEAETGAPQGGSGSAAENTSQTPHKHLRSSLQLDMAHLAKHV